MDLFTRARAQRGARQQRASLPPVSCQKDKRQTPPANDGRPHPEPRIPGPAPEAPNADYVSFKRNSRRSSTRFITI